MIIFVCAYLCRPASSISLLLYISQIFGLFVKYFNNLSGHLLSVLKQQNDEEQQSLWWQRLLSSMDLYTMELLKLLKKITIR